MHSTSLTSSVLSLSIFELCVALVGSVAVSAGALYYFRRVRMDRPAIGTFNGRDILILGGFLVILPTLYLLLPRWALTSFLALTFIASISIGFRPVVGAARVWLGIGVLLGVNIWIARTMLGTVAGWQLFWAENSVIVLLGAIAVANLYIQGGMRLRHVALFGLLLAAYDVIFSAVVHTTNDLVQEFLGFPLNPSIGMRLGFDNASIGLGDLLVYGLFTVAAFKAYGRRGARLAMALVVLFGALLPSMVPLAVNYIDTRADVLVPAQAYFGPVAYLGYRWMVAHWGRERTMREFLASDDALVPAPAERPLQTAGSGEGALQPAATRPVVPVAQKR